MKALTTILLLFFSVSVPSSAAWDIDRAQGIIGILPLPEVFGSGPCDRFKPLDINLFLNPHSSNHIGRIYVSKPWSFPSVGGCEGLEVSVSIAEPTPIVENLPTLEFSYENPGAIVLERKGTWLKIALNEGHAWLQVQEPRRYIPVEELFRDALSYLREQNRLPLLNSPSRDEVVWSPNPAIPGRLPVEVVEFKEISGRLWVRVKILEVEPCAYSAPS